jgi:hypothetical protein
MNIGVLQVSIEPASIRISPNCSMTRHF